MMKYILREAGALSTFLSGQTFGVTKRLSLEIQIIEASVMRVVPGSYECSPLIGRKIGL